MPLAQSLKYVYTKCSSDRHHTAGYKTIYPLLSQHFRSTNHPKVHVSSLGIIDEHSDPDLNDVWVGGGSATAALTAYVWTFKRGFNLAVWYNDAFYDEEVVEFFLQTTKSIVISGLGL